MRRALLFAALPLAAMLVPSACAVLDSTSETNGDAESEALHKHKCRDAGHNPPWWHCPTGSSGSSSSGSGTSTSGGDGTGSSSSSSGGDATGSSSSSSTSGGDGTGS